MEKHMARTHRIGGRRRDGLTDDKGIDCIRNREDKSPPRSHRKATNRKTRRAAKTAMALVMLGDDCPTINNDRLPWWT